MSYFQDRQEKTRDQVYEKKAKEWRAEGEALMAGNPKFAKWKLTNTVCFGILTFISFAGFLFLFDRFVLPLIPKDPNNDWVARGGALFFGGTAWQLGRRRYTEKCRKLSLAAEWDKLQAKHAARKIQG